MILPKENCERKNKQILGRDLKLECRSMRANLIFSGLTEEQDEDEQSLRSVLISLLEDDLATEDTQNIQFLACHRLPQWSNKGPKANNRPKNVVARFARMQVVTMILRNVNKLQGRNPPIHVYIYI